MAMAPGHPRRVTPWPAKPLVRVPWVPRRDRMASSDPRRPVPQALRAQAPCSPPALPLRGPPARRRIRPRRAAAGANGARFRQPSSGRLRGRDPPARRRVRQRRQPGARQVVRRAVRWTVRWTVRWAARWAVRHRRRPPVPRLRHRGSLPARRGRAAAARRAGRRGSWPSPSRARRCATARRWPPASIASNAREPGSARAFRATVRRLVPVAGHRAMRCAADPRQGASGRCACPSSFSASARAPGAVSRARSAAGSWRFPRPRRSPRRSPPRSGRPPPAAGRPRAARPAARRRLP